MLRRWSRRLVKVVLAVCVLAVIGAGFEQWGRRDARARFAAPGRLVQVDGRAIHLHCTGRGSPTVLLESGAGSPASVWAKVQPELSRLTRACSYDRPGLGWSQPPRRRRDAVGAAADLRALAEAAGERPPFVLVGHSLGGPRSLVFAQQYPRDVAGVVLVDATHPTWRTRLPEALRDEEGGPSLRRRAMFWAATELGVIRLAQMALADAGSSRERRQARAFAPQTLRGTLAEGEGTSELLERASAVRSLGDVPLVVLTADTVNVPPGVSDAVRDTVRALRLETQRELAGLSTAGAHRMVAGSGHVIPIDAPAAVVDAVREVVRRVPSASWAPLRPTHACMYFSNTSLKSRRVCWSSTAAFIASSTAR